MNWRIGIACLLVLASPLVKAPINFAAVLVVAALIVRRAWVQKSIVA